MIEPSKVKEAFKRIEEENYAFRAYLKNHADEDDLEMQLKGIIKNMASKTGINANAILQNYMLERLLERISLSDYKWKFILKGGMLISAMVGLDNRTTMDMDATIKSIDFSKDIMLSIFEQIIKVPVQDDVKFNLKGIEKIREEAEYGGYRISLDATYKTMESIIC